MYKLATLEDLPRIVELVEMAYTELPYGLKFDHMRAFETLENVLDNGVIICRLATVQDHPEIVGVLIAVKTFTTVSLEPIASELLWYVHPDHRSSKRALELLNAFELWGRLQNCSALIMGNMANASAESTHRLYLRKGYQLSEQTYFKRIN